MSTPVMSIRKEPAPDPGRQKEFLQYLDRWEAEIRESIRPQLEKLQQIANMRAMALGSYYEGLGNLAAVRKLLMQRNEPMSREDIAAALLQAGFKPQGRPERETRDYKRSPMAPDQKIIRAISRYIHEGDLLVDRDQKITLPEWKKK
jgi:hypothetical protein